MAKNLVYKATSDDNKDPTGFVLKELATLSQSSLKDCIEIQEQLLKRLNKDKPDVKFKVLRSIKYLCIHGRPDFRMELHRNHVDIKACQGFKGPPDPLRGDAPYQRVRDEAKECMNAIFNAPAIRPGGQAVVGRIEGYGSQSTDNNNGNTSNTSNSNGNNTGYTNPSYHTSSPDNGNYSVSSHPSSTGARMEAMGSSENKFKPKANSTSAYKPYSGGNNTGNNSSYPTTSYSNGSTTVDSGPSHRQRGQVGGNWGNEGPVTQR